MKVIVLTCQAIAGTSHLNICRGREGIWGRLSEIDISKGLREYTKREKVLFLFFISAFFLRNVYVFLYILHSFSRWSEQPTSLFSSNSALRLFLIYLNQILTSLTNPILCNYLSSLFLMVYYLYLFHTHTHTLGFIITALKIYQQSF